MVKTMASWFSGENRGVMMAWWGTNYVLGRFFGNRICNLVGRTAGLAASAWVATRVPVAGVDPSCHHRVFFVYDKDTPEKAGCLGEVQGNQLATQADRSNWKTWPSCCATPPSG